MTDSAMDVDPCCFACCGFDTALLLAIPAYSFIIIIIIIIKGIYTAQGPQMRYVGRDSSMVT